MPWYLHLLIDNKKTQRQNFFNENTEAKKEQNIPRTLRSYHVSIFIRRPFSNRGKDQRKLKSPLLPDSTSQLCSPLLEPLLSERKKKKRRSLFSPPFRGRIIVAWKFINRDNKQDPANDPLYSSSTPSLGWNIGFYTCNFLRE